jgi:hypothetical protein
MSKGALLIAHNNSQINYVKLAVNSARRIKKFLEVPVSLITDSDSIKNQEDLEIFDKIILVETGASANSKYFYDGIDKSVNLSWNNLTRSTCFNLSPYDETLVLDVDYILNSSTLKNCWNQQNDFLIYKQSVDFATWRNSKEFKYISDYSIEFYWATVFFFRKTEATASFFRLVDHVKENWSYYKVLYQLHSTNFRNDYAFSIAIHMMNGFKQGDFAAELPGKMFYTLDTDILLENKDTSYKFLLQNNSAIGGYLPASISNIDLHIMNKYSLLRSIDSE